MPRFDPQRRQFANWNRKTIFLDKDAWADECWRFARACHATEVHTFSVQQSDKENGKLSLYRPNQARDWHNKFTAVLGVMLPRQKHDWSKQFQTQLWKVVPLGNSRWWDKYHERPGSRKRNYTHSARSWQRQRHPVVARSFAAALGVNKFAIERN